MLASRFETSSVAIWLQQPDLKRTEWKTRAVGEVGRLPGGAEADAPLTTDEPAAANPLSIRKTTPTGPLCGPHGPCPLWPRPCPRSRLPDLLRPATSF